MQKAGLLPTIITLLFLCSFSTFSSMCLSETGRLINGIKNNHYKRFDYMYLINSLISDSIFAHSSRFCVIINHLLYTMLCIITLAKTCSIFIIDKFSLLEVFSSNSKTNGISTHTNTYGEIMHQIGNTIISNEKMVLIISLFAIFIVIYFLSAFKLFKKMYNFTILISSISMITLLLTYLINLNVNSKMSQSNVNLNRMVPLFGSDFTYVSSFKQKLTFQICSCMEQFYFLSVSCQQSQIGPKKNTSKL